MRFNKKSIAVAAILVVSLGLTACGGADDGGEDGSAFTFLPKNLGNPYFDTSEAGAQSAADELGVTVTQVGPDAASPEAQVPFINTAAQQGADALIISANDP